MKKFILVLLFSLLSMVQASASPLITANLVPSRTTGVAPLAVHFDATGSVAPTLVADPFRQLSYTFTFGDNRGLKWPVSNLPKNKEVGGPVAAHVFDLPGTYTVTVAVTDPATGTQTNKKTTITVSDPDVVYAGANTICVSGVGDWTGCPVGAQHISAIPSGNPVWSNKRILLRRGETFGDVWIQVDNANVQVGAYGTGALPIVNSVGVGNWRPANANFANDVTVMDLAVVLGANASVGRRFFFYRLDMTSASNEHGIYIGGTKNWAENDTLPGRVPMSEFYYASEVFVIENKVVGSFTDGGYNYYGDGSKVAVLGNTGNTSKFHTARFVKLRKAILAHNDFKGINSDGVYHDLKIHSGGMTPYTDAYVDDAWYSEQIVIQNNRFGSTEDNNQWLVAICPQNDQSAEGIQDVLIQSNTFTRNSRTVQDLTLAGRRLTYRGNIIQGGGSLTEGVGHDASLPMDWKGPYYSN